MQITHLEVPTDRNPLGIRGVGESGTIPGYAVVGSAVDDALGGGTPPVRQVPIDGDVVLALIAQVPA
jgi:carbon-monoxide dehydrogenase large subunit